MTVRCDYPVVASLLCLHPLGAPTLWHVAAHPPISPGAPHNIDETWAIYTGIKPACSLWGSANRRGAEFGTMQDCNTR